MVCDDPTLDYVAIGTDGSVSIFIDEYCTFYIALIIQLQCADVVK